MRDSALTPSPKDPAKLAIPAPVVNGGSREAATERAGEPSLDETLTFWRGRTPRPLTLDDASEIRENLKGFLQVLLDWAEADAAPGAKKP